MFKPEEIIFAPTARCNLRCSHCHVSRSFKETLDAKASVKFLKSAAAQGINRVGFSGGEPFLVPDFLAEISRAAVGLDMLFGRLMTNGLWYRNRQDLASVLNQVAASGFDGKIGLSADSYHRSVGRELLPFIIEVFRAFGRKDCLDITAVVPGTLSKKKKAGGDRLYKSIARGLGGHLECDRQGRPVRIRDDSTSMLDGEALFIPINRIDCSGGPDADRWNDGRWFRDDFCEGPGQVLYVHPDGRIAPCCGFANESKELIIGSIYEDDAKTVIGRARKMPILRAVYNKGLGKLRQELERKGTRFPGKTGDICFFCEYICSRKLI